MASPRSQGLKRLKTRHQTAREDDSVLQLQQLCDSIVASMRLELSTKNHDPSSTGHCGNAIRKLLLRQIHLIGSRHSQRRLADLISLAHSKFYAYPFSQVPPCWLSLFTDASILQACSIVYEGNQDTPDQVGKVVRLLDTAVILTGARRPQRQRWITDIMNALEQSSADHSDRQLVSIDLNSITSPTPDVFVEHPVTRIGNCSLEAFTKNMFQPNNISTGPTPIVISEVMEHWPALQDRPWSSLDYLFRKTIGGQRLVPLEIGRSYVDEGWTQKITTFAEFFRQYVLQEAGKPLGETGYLAQYALFDQIPSLRNDIIIPDYCYMVPSRPHSSSPLATKHLATPTLRDVAINAWLGPAGTISPLHTDPYHNILAQVVGRKYVRLYAPKESSKLYARGVENGTIDMTNNSRLDIGILEGWDGTGKDRLAAHKQFPLYSSAPFVDCILEPGDCLYIPVGWWHYVRSLSISFSVNFWWNNWNDEAESDKDDE